MNRIKHNFYKKHIKYTTMKMWFEYKPLFELGFNRYFRGEYKPKRRHHRSVTIRNIRKIYGFMAADLAWKVELCEHENRSHGVAVEQSRKRRLYVYYY